MKISKLEIRRIIISILLISTYILISTKDLYIDVINPDGINWHERTQAFMEALSTKHYCDTYQTYHPGTTLMWISGPILNIFKANNIEAPVFALGIGKTWFDSTWRG